jgi:hypothetical protein
MRRHRIPLLLVVGIVPLLGLAPPDAPISLRYHPEEGLAVTYDGEIQGAILVSVMGQANRLPFEMTERHVDRIVQAGEAGTTLEREVTAMAIKAEGKSQNAPAGVLGKKETYVLNELAQVIRHTTQEQGTPKDDAQGFAQLTSLAALPIVVVPFPSEPVSPGDTWDTSKYLMVTDAQMPLNVTATTMLISIYESEGMNVALTQTTFTATGSVTPTAPQSPGAAAPTATISLSGSLLQSVRLDDGCVLGIKAKLSGGLELGVPGGTGMSVKLDNVTWRSAVAGE